MYIKFKLKEFREKRGWSQRKLSRASGVSQAQISELEKGTTKPTLDTAYQLAFALGIHVEEMVETYSTFEESIQLLKTRTQYVIVAEHVGKVVSGDYIRKRSESLE